MRNLIGLKNMLIFSVVLLTIVSAQQAFAGPPLPCQSNGDGNWNDPSSWLGCDGGTPDANTNALIFNANNIIITGDEETQQLTIAEAGTTLFIDCDASLNLFVGGGSVTGPANITNHGTFTSVENFTINGFLFNSGDLSNIVEGTGSIVEISTKCTQPIGGTVGSMSTTSLLVAGAQANMGLWSLALVGMVAAGAAITYKVKSKKTKQ